LIKLPMKGHGGKVVVSALAFRSKDLSSNRAGYYFSLFFGKDKYK